MYISLRLLSSLHNMPQTHTYIVVRIQLYCMYVHIFNRLIYNNEIVDTDVCVFYFIIPTSVPIYLFRKVLAVKCANICK